MSLSEIQSPLSPIVDHRLPHMLTKPPSLRLSRFTLRCRPRTHKAAQPQLKLPQPVGSASLS